MNQDAKSICILSFHHFSRHKKMAHFEVSAEVLNHQVYFLGLLIIFNTNYNKRHLQSSLMESWQHSPFHKGTWHGCITVILSSAPLEQVLLAQGH